MVQIITKNKIKVGDIVRVVSYDNPYSVYYGNGKKAIVRAIDRSDFGQHVIRLRIIQEENEFNIF